MNIKLEILVDRDPDGPTYLTFYRDGKRVTANELGVTVYTVDPGSVGATATWAAEMAEQAEDASPAVQAEVAELVEGYVR